MKKKIFFYLLQELDKVEGFNVIAFLPLNQFAYQ